MRIAPPDTDGAASPTQGFVPIKNRPPGENPQLAYHIISPDSLALVRFGLRAADDPRILNTIRVIDALLRVQLPQGPCWYRYNGDGYGEHKDGSPFNGTGIGRPWPLLAGERAHYELAAGRVATKRRHLLTMMEALPLTARAACFPNRSGMQTISLRMSYSAASLQARLARWFGPIPST